MPLLKSLAWLQPIYYDTWFVFIYVKTGKVLLAIKTLIKKHDQQPWKHKTAATLTSSHESGN